MTDARILIVDDDIDLCELVAEYLETEGFYVESIHGGRQGVSQAVAGHYDLVILDVMLPELGGIEALRRLRAQTSVPVLMLTARTEETERILGLEVGADDYMHKPFNPRELAARIRAILRRVQTPTPMSEQEEVVTVGDVQVRVGAREVHSGKQSITLTAVEFDVLLFLLRCAGRVASRDDLIQAAFGRERLAYERSIDMHVSNIRRKLGLTPGGQERIRSIRSIGYLYALPSAEETSPQPSPGRAAR